MSRTEAAAARIYLTPQSRSGHGAAGGICQPLLRPTSRHSSSHRSRLLTISLRVVAPFARTCSSYESRKAYAADSYNATKIQVILLGLASSYLEPGEKKFARWFNSARGAAGDLRVRPPQAPACWTTGWSRSGVRFAGPARRGFGAGSVSRPSSQAGRNAASHAATRPSC